MVQIQSLAWELLYAIGVAIKKKKKKKKRGGKEEKQQTFKEVIAILPNAPRKSWRLCWEKS